MRVPKLLAFVSVALVVAACATSPGIGRLSDEPLYYGYGTGGTITEALNRAKQGILRQVTADLLDETTLAAKRDNLTTIFYESDLLNGYFYLDTMETIGQGRDGDDFWYSVGIRVNLDAVVRTLGVNNIYGGMVLPGKTDMQLADKPQPAVTRPSKPQAQKEAAKPEVQDAPSVVDTLSPEERRIVESYLSDLTFLIYFDDASDEDPFLMKAAVGIANRYLAEEGINLVDLETVERIKKDQELAYEAEAGEAVSLIQWISQKLNADVYVEIGSETTSETDDGKYYGQANIVLDFFDSSTADLLASVTYRSPRTFSSSSELDAVNNALQSSVYQSLPIALEQVYTRMRDMSEEGIPYDLVMQQTPDARLMRDFMKRLEGRSNKVEIVSQSAEETRYRVYLLGSAADLQDVVFDIADAMPFLRNLQLVYLRGKSLTFTTGL